MDNRVEVGVDGSVERSFLLPFPSIDKRGFGQPCGGLDFSEDIHSPGPESSNCSMGVSIVLGAKQTVQGGHPAGVFTGPKFPTSFRTDSTRFGMVPKGGLHHCAPPHKLRSRPLRSVTRSILTSTRKHTF